MSQFDEREKSFEAKHSHDREQEFKAIARRNKLLGLWAAEQMGITGDAADGYAKEVVMADFDEPGDDDVLRKVLGDMQGKGIDTSEHLIRKQMTELLDVARLQVKNEA
ncbi:DUF1476 domain-containing protein [Rhodospirillaceae bacterium KN72]|uniref:DUF1476 domain-containing protein n=1 Tax=Pacificispira spongiicola TaxID=2729598 RepID=A0A7Y0DZE2_9PROT|nr:DUF1476 domain-containing protein [Pacificispira spongiicola]NMM44412.1 DUF1476 domain-containing protein [Pacificispira spongiicola]